MTDAVVVLHGIFQPAFTMLPLCRFLEKEGYSVLNLDYPSTSYPIEEIAEMIADRIEAHGASVDGKLHLVGFSMGGLVIRAFLRNLVPLNLGKVVMIGTPNQGSEVADFLKSFLPFRYLYGPAGQQLVTDQKEFAAIFANDGFSLGIIAGDSSSYSIMGRIIGKPSDGKVSVASTKLACVADHLVVNSSHTMLPHNGTVWIETASFLRKGAFSHSEKVIDDRDAWRWSSLGSGGKRDRWREVLKELV
jgi:pimeloyl-ACP methyl ester carboxylesterase